MQSRCKRTHSRSQVSESAWVCHIWRRVRVPGLGVWPQLLGSPWPSPQLLMAHDTIAQLPWMSSSLRHRLWCSRVTVGLRAS